MGSILLNRLIPLTGMWYAMQPDTYGVAQGFLNYVVSRYSPKDVKEACFGTLLYGLAISE